jgi:hypothetical protein
MTKITQEQCPMCGGTGWKESHIDDLGHGHGGWCRYCSGTGQITVERPDYTEREALVALARGETKKAVLAKLARVAGAAAAAIMADGSIAYSGFCHE